MKKILLTLLLALPFCMVAKAQDFRVGITGGYNLSSPSGYKSQSGFHVGVKGELGLPHMAGRVRDTITTVTITPLQAKNRTNHHLAILQTISVPLTT